MKACSLQLLCVFALLFTPLVHSKKEENIIPLSNGVGLRIGYNFESQMASMKRKLIDSGVWIAEYSLINEHYKCIKPYLNDEITLKSPLKKYNEKFKKLQKERNVYPSFIANVKTKKKPREYFLKARFTSEISREILENIDWEIQSPEFLNTLRSFRACYFLYHGALNSLGKIEKSYSLEEYKDNQRQLKLKALGLNDNLSMLGSALLGRSEKGDKRREKDPVIFNNINPIEDVKAIIGKKKVNQIVNGVERLIDYQGACLCLKQYEESPVFCDEAKSFNLSVHIEALGHLSAYTQEKIKTKKKINLQETDDNSHAYTHITQNKKELISLNKSLYESLRKELVSLAIKQNIEPVMCATDLLANNTSESHIEKDRLK